MRLIIPRMDGKENVTEKPNSIHKIRYGTHRGESGVRCRPFKSPSSNCVLCNCDKTVEERRRQCSVIHRRPKRGKRREFFLPTTYLISLSVSPFSASFLVVVSNVPHFVRSLSNLKLGSGAVRREKGNLVERGRTVCC